MVISSSSPIGTRLHNSTETYAVLDRVEQVIGGPQLTSTLSVTLPIPSVGEQNHTVICLNSDLGTQQSVTFQVAGT